MFVAYSNEDDKPKPKMSAQGQKVVEKMQIDLTRRMKYELIETDVLKKITDMCPD